VTPKIEASEKKLRKRFWITLTGGVRVKVTLRAACDYLHVPSSDPKVTPQTAIGLVRKLVEFAIAC